MSSPSSPNCGNLVISEDNQSASLAFSLNSEVSTKCTGVLLATARVNDLGPNGTKIQVRALIDPGSPIPLVTQALCNLLSLNCRTSHTHIQGIDKKTVAVSSKVACLFKPHFNSTFSLEVDGIVLPKLTSYKPPVICRISNFEYLLNVLFWLKDHPSRWAFLSLNSAPRFTLCYLMHFWITCCSSTTTQLCVRARASVDCRGLLLLGQVRDDTGQAHVSWASAQATRCEKDEKAATLPLPLPRELCTKIPGEHDLRYAVRLHATTNRNCGTRRWNPAASGQFTASALGSETPRRDIQGIVTRSSRSKNVKPEY